ncbi:uncharacterized protein LOC129759680 [Uranotaenia lowii]|uniref:uncharacterized protein LOC129759680 n=1 Tax=Uranotaenia lowii TaxID=190385 RepID=UPI00247A3319|nr:uncharacterized protein LOC129759680 [Uranotaenia lowii]
MIVGELFQSAKQSAKTAFFFALSCIILPVLIISFSIVSITRKIWIAFLSNRYPYLKFARTNNIRSLVDTSRNPGVFHVLLQVEGLCDIHAIKAKFIDHVLSRRDQLGRLFFARLKFPLISCWGQYAFVKQTKDFNIDNHIILAPALHRGRPLTESNLQDFVSDIISKYMPSDIPPWQVFCIPMASGTSASSGSAECDSTVPYYYLLYRVHHLLLEEQRNLRISDLLLIDLRSTCAESANNISECGSIFTNLMERPVHLPKIWNDLNALISNKWNEFVYQHDPLESPDLEKKHIAGIQQLMSVTLIGIVSVVSDFYRGFSKVSGNPLRKIDFLKSLIDREICRRNLNLGTIWTAIISSLDPINVIKEWIFLLWKIGATLTLMVPWYIFREFEAIRIYVLMKKYKRNTVIGFLMEYIPVCLKGVSEFGKGIQLLYTAPKLIHEELFEHKPDTDHYLQNVSLCGRKVVSWSERIEATEFRINYNEGMPPKRTGSIHLRQCNKTCTEIEILLGIISRSIGTLCRNGDGKLPRNVLLSGRCMLDDYLLGTTDYKTGNSGFISLTLPLDVSDKRQLIKQIRLSIEKIRRQQVMVNFLTIVQLKHDLMTNALPVVISKLLMNYLSRRFAITVTEVIENQANAGARKNLLGHTIRDIVYFRPPQSNTSVSLTVQRFNNEIRIACIADSQISPKHLALTNGFRRYLHDFKKLTTGVSTINE